MRTKKTIVLVAAVALMVTGPAVVPAAAEGSTGHFQCVGTLSVWAGSGSTTCSGLARGVFREGPTILLCAPYCSYTMDMTYTTICVGTEPPLVAGFRGDITITDLSSIETPFSGLSVGGDLAFTTSSPVGVGDGALVLNTPIGTCDAPGPVNYSMAGVLAFD